MTKIDQIADRIVELEELAAAEGITLPMPASVIARIELVGDVVDLRTGAIIAFGSVERYSLGGSMGAGEPVTPLDELIERIERVVANAKAQQRDDVAGLRSDLERLAETVRLTTGPVDVALQVDAQRDDVAQLKLRIENLLDVCEAQEARLRKLEQRLVELEDHVWGRLPAHASPPTVDQALLRNQELCGMFDALGTRGQS